MKICNFTSNNGNKVANQFLLTLDNCYVFQSYQSIIAVKFPQGFVLDKDYWDYSTTTGKYRNQFTGMDTKETIKAIESGKVILADLQSVDLSKAKYSDFLTTGATPNA